MFVDPSNKLNGSGGGQEQKKHAQVSSPLLTDVSLILFLLGSPLPSRAHGRGDGAAAARSGRRGGAKQAGETQTDRSLVLLVVDTQDQKEEEAYYSIPFSYSFFKIGEEVAPRYFNRKPSIIQKSRGKKAAYRIWKLIEDLKPAVKVLPFEKDQIEPE